MKEVFTQGDGPFVAPLLAEFRGADIAPGVDHCVLEFRCEDGAAVLLPISTQAAAALNLALTVWMSKQPAPPGRKQ